jgi:hypothetical protein
VDQSAREMDERSHTRGARLARYFSPFVIILGYE